MTDRPASKSLGEHLQAGLDRIGMSQADLARRTNLSAKHVNQLASGAVQLTADVALRLEHVTGVPAEDWAAADVGWRLQRARQAEQDNLGDFLTWYDRFTTADLLTFGVIDTPDRTVENLRRLLTFLGVATPGAAEDVWVNKTLVQAHGALPHGNDHYRTMVWLRACEIVAAPVWAGRCAPEKLRILLPMVRGCAAHHDPMEQRTQTRKALAVAGVPLIETPPPDGLPVATVSRWVGPGRPLLVVDPRLEPPTWWRTLFHGLGHLLEHGKRQVFFCPPPGGGVPPDEERFETEAGRFAQRRMPQRFLRERPAEQN